MATLPVVAAVEDFPVSLKFNLLKALRGFCSLIAVLLLTPCSIFAAESSLIAPGAKLEKLGEGFSFTEGPAADREGNVFFTDEPNDRIVKWSAADGKLTDWLTPAGGANGTYFDKAGNLVVAAQQKGELWSIAPGKKVTVLVGTFEGKQFNGPNDLWISPDGGVYFTDPFYRVRFMTRDPKAQMDGQHVYFLAPDRKTVMRVADDLFQPNGIIGTPDGKRLYVGDFGGATWVYDIRPDGGLTNKRLFYDSGSDGMTIDVEGNVYLTRNGVIILDKTGKKIEQILVPLGSTSNVTFGGENCDLLFITAESYVYGLRMRVRGAC